MVYDYKKHEWNFIEKSNKADTNIYGDNYKDVELYIWNIYRNPIRISDLTIDKKQISDQMYFVNKKQTIHEAPIKMNNFVKRIFVKQDMDTVIDLASGRGSDLWNYVNAGVKKLLFTEIDNDAIDEVISRKYQIDNNNTQLNIINVNLNDSYKNTLSNINKYFIEYSNGVSNIFCFFAFHYLTDTLPHIKNITSLIGHLLKKNGEFLYTAFDERAVMDLMEKNNGRWIVRESGIKKYDIIQKYSTKDINTATRKIKLILPFNSPDYYYDENLINEKMVNKEFLKYNVKVKQEGSFLDFIYKFKKSKPYLFNKLTDDDKIFINLYKYKIYSKN